MPDVLRVGNISQTDLSDLLERYQLMTQLVDSKNPIPGSFWGDEEAGLIENRVYIRSDTPVHSVLHESCHYVCMDEPRRQRLNTNAGGDSDEENAVCYLQVLLANELSWMGRERMFQDMDAWGYSFRLGSAKTWFENDAEDARKWLIRHKLINTQLRPTFQYRDSQVDHR